MKNIIIAILAFIILVGVGAYLYTSGMLGLSLSANAPVEEQPVQETATTTPETKPTLAENEMVIGTSVEGRNISAFTYGSGAKKLLFVGGIHGGYEWNTVLLAYQMMDYFAANPDALKNVEVTIVPVLNPDGLYKVVGKEGRFVAADVSTAQDVLASGRFNANHVDLNRNFDCDWQPTGMWKNSAVDGGSAVFSEPESAAIKQYIEMQKPNAVLGWFSAAGGVYSSSCGGAVLPETTTITNVFAKASGYPAHKSFDNYAISGDMENWLAKIKIPAISVLLTDHTNVEWEKNIKGVEALITQYSK